jgi:hypothetical protein
MRVVGALLLLGVAVASMCLLGEQTAAIDMHRVHWMRAAARASRTCAVPTASSAVLYAATTGLLMLFVPCPCSSCCCAECDDCTNKKVVKGKTPTVACCSQCAAGKPEDAANSPARQVLCGVWSGVEIEQNAAGNSRVVSCRVVSCRVVSRCSECCETLEPALKVLCAKATHKVEDKMLHKKRGPQLLKNEAGRARGLLPNDQ